MSKKPLYPRLYVRVKKGSNGRIYTYYSYDMRLEGKKDLQLGSDRDAAIAKWHELQDSPKQAVTKGRLKEAFDRWMQDELPKYTNDKTRRGYTQNMAKLEPVFGMATWQEVTLPILRQYLDKRSAKTQGNREMALLSIIWHKAMLWGMTEKQWPATGVKGWKNAENARSFEVTDALFEAVYAQADRILRDCMDISTATGMRLTDAISVRMPVNGILRHTHSKTGKRSEFDVSQSPTLVRLCADRQAIAASCVMLMTSDTGGPVTLTMLRSRWDAAREKAANANPELAEEIRAMYLRDMRKRAADLAGSAEDAAELLQHSSKALTLKHYRTKATKLKAAR